MQANPTLPGWRDYCGKLSKLTIEPRKVDRALCRGLAYGRRTRKYFNISSPSIEANGWRQTLQCNVSWAMPGLALIRTTL